MNNSNVQIPLLHTLTLEYTMKFRFFALLSYFFLLLPNLPPTTADLSSDKQALLYFAAAVPHQRQLNWNSSVPICTSWVGITCNENGTRVIAVHLPAVGLYGAIPANCLGKLDALRILSLRSNFLNGKLPSDIPSIPSLQSLYLQNNNLSGNIPPFLSPQLTVVDFSFNSFTGKIPATLKNLKRLAMLNLQINSFSGDIPDLNLPRLRFLNLSHNMFNSSIPFSLQKFPVSSFTGNLLLCGLPLNRCSTVSPSPSPDYLTSIPIHIRKHKKKLSTGVIIAIAVGLFSLLLLLALVYIFFRLKKNTSVSVFKAKASNGGKNEKSDDFGSGVQAAEKNKLVFFEGSLYNFNLEDLLRASAEVLGKGSYGTAYKAVLDEGTMVVVKRMKEVGIGKKEFEQHIELVERIGRHPNVVPLYAYYFSKDEKLLVYEYMHAGSLSALLHGNRGIGRTPLDWESRLKIALGSARGLAHIHNEGGVNFIHGNIKSSNILATRDFNGCISDLGLAPLMNFLATKSRAIGYRAPEVFETRKLTQSSDVYSFGVLLLEILTGKAPLPTSGHEESIDLPRWVRSVVREEWTAEVFDVELMRYQNVEEEMVQMLQIALSCVGKVADMRPSMNEVVKMIEDLRQSEESDYRPSSEDVNSKDSNVQTP